MWGAVVGGALSYLGSRSAARSQAAAADRQIAMQREMQQRAEEAAKFRPVGFTSPYGTADIQVEDGRLTSVGFDLSPEMQARAERFGELGETMLGGISVDPMAAAAERTARLQALEAPGRAEAQERLFSNLAAKGLTGLAVETGTGARVNPYAAAQAEEFAMRDARTAAQSYDVARDQIAQDLARAQGLFTAQQGVYDIGRSELGFGLDLADIERQRAISAATGQAQFGQNISQIIGQQGAARAQQQAALYGGLGQAVSGMNFGGGPSLSGLARGGATLMGSTYNTNPMSEQSRMLAAQDFGLY